MRARTAEILDTVNSLILHKDPTFNVLDFEILLEIAMGDLSLPPEELATAIVTIEGLEFIPIIELLIRLAELEAKNS